MRSSCYTRRFWDRLAPHYDQAGGHPDRNYHLTLQTIRTCIDERQSVLDYGCGTGSYLCELASSGAEFTALDISGKMLDLAREKCRDRHQDRIRFLQGDIFTDSLKESSFDLILACSVLHLSADPQKVIDRLGSLLKDQGLLISSTPTMSAWTPYYLLIRVLTGIGYIPSCSFFSLEGLTGMLEHSGLRVEQTTKTESSPLQYCIICRKA